MKSNKNITMFEEHLTKQYGQIGSEKRTEFEAKAKSFVIGELLKEERLEANLTQEELADKIRVVSNRERYFKRIDVTSMESKIMNFLDSQMEKDVAQVTDDEMDQALFEAQYVKPAKETKPYKGILILNNESQFISLCFLPCTKCKWSKIY